MPLLKRHARCRAGARQGERIHVRRDRAVPVFERGVATLDFVPGREVVVGTLSGRITDATGAEETFALSLAPGAYPVTASSNETEDGREQNRRVEFNIVE